MKIRIIVNPISGRNRRLQNKLLTLEQAFADHGVQAQVMHLQRRGQATELARQAVARGFDMVVAVGGDGTINEVVCGLVNSGVPLGIVPAGSGNGISREFGISLDTRRACETILSGQTWQVDVGRLDDRFFLGVAGVGYDALVGKLFEERWGGHRGLWPYIYSAFTAFFQYKAQPVCLRLGDRQLETIPLLITVANTAQFGGGAVIAPQAKPNDGLLDVCVVEDLNFLQALFHWPKLFLRRIHRMPQWTKYRTDSLEISSHLPMPVHVDGEPIPASTHLSIRILPGALHIRVPDDRPRVFQPSSDSS